MKPAVGAHMLGAGVLIGAVLCATPAAAGGALSVGDLKTLCATSAAGCRYFIYGVVEGATFGDGFKTPGSQLCVAPTATIQDLELAVKTALSKVSDRAVAGGGDDDDDGPPAAAFIASVTTDRFPCPR